MSNAATSAFSSNGAREPLLPPPALDAAYLEAMYARWKADPSSVGESWSYFFQGFELAMCPRACVAAEAARAQSAVAALIEAYRCRGHLFARTDPLGSEPPGGTGLPLGEFGLSEGDLDRVFDAGDFAGLDRATLREIVAALEDTYCRSIGAEYRHVQDPAPRRWLEEEMESCRNRPPLERERRLAILRLLFDAELFETFLQSRYPGQKRFSLEGGESLIPALDALVEEAADLGVEEIILGMAHRGRLNVLANLLGKSLAQVFAEFEDNPTPNMAWGDGDVKYHQGYATERKTSSGRRIRLDLTANPSHLEAVDPVVEGRTRARQRRLGDTAERRRVLPLLLHGDAAFAGQGLVAETLNLSQLEGYRTGGTVHVVVNNQIGFTTTPKEARSTAYATDVAKMIEAPILHVNGDDPEAAVWAATLAVRFRQRFGRDVVVDLVCYRRHGHNETDEPGFTQPLLYRRIEQHPPVRLLYARRLVDAGDLSAEDEARMAEERRAAFQRAMAEVREQDDRARAETTRLLAGPGAGEEGGDPVAGQTPAAAGVTVPTAATVPAPELAPVAPSGTTVATGVPLDTLREVAVALGTVPPSFIPHPKLARLLAERTARVREGGRVDWALAEALAIGSLLVEGIPVRLSGQDTARGTFSQRHAVLVDARTEEHYVPLNHIRPGQADLCVHNSMLSEAAVLGFEYGYSLDEPDMLVAWEAQFGDFSNGAQVIVDQFVTSSAAKWGRTCGLVMLLPHGCEGQGPEHSHAYLERYLAACACDNLEVCNLTTPAQYFHLLRRQVKRPFRRPLVLMAPKSLLRHPLALSGVEELVEGRFHEVLDDPSPPPRAKARRLVLCSGKLFYDLLDGRRRLGVEDVALVRIEQLYPFPDDGLAAVAERYATVQEVVWAQEETENRGAWTYLRPRLQERFGVGRRSVRYVGRPAYPSPARGSLRVHLREQEAVVREALTVTGRAGTTA